MTDDVTDYPNPVLDRVGRTWVLRNEWKPPYGPVVRAGFHTDLVSSPKWAEIFGIGNDSNGQRFAALAHDYAFSPEGRCSFSQANINFYKNLRKFGISRIIASLMYASVQEFGRSHYEGKDPS